MPPTIVTLYPAYAGYVFFVLPDGRIDDAVPTARQAHVNHGGHELAFLQALDHGRTCGDTGTTGRLSFPASLTVCTAKK